MAQQRSARYGQSLYEVVVRETEQVSFQHVKHLYLAADSIAVKDGTLMLAAEVDGDEDEETPNGGKAIEVPPIAIFPAGQWLSVILVTWDTHTPLFSQEFIEAIDGEGED